MRRCQWKFSCLAWLWLDTLFFHNIRTWVSSRWLQQIMPNQALLLYSISPTSYSSTLTFFSPVCIFVYLYTTVWWYGTIRWYYVYDYTKRYYGRSATVRCVKDLQPRLNVSIIDFTTFYTSECSLHAHHRAVAQSFFLRYFKNFFLDFSSLFYEVR